MSAMREAMLSAGIGDRREEEDDKSVSVRVVYDPRATDEDVFLQIAGYELAESESVVIELEE